MTLWWTTSPSMIRKPTRSRGPASKFFLSNVAGTCSNTSAKTIWRIRDEVVQKSGDGAGSHSRDGCGGLHSGRSAVSLDGRDQPLGAAATESQFDDQRSRVRSGIFLRF